MLLDGLQTQNSILGASMQGHMARKEVILNNIANVDTPGFKKKVVTFEEDLKDSLRRSKTGEKLDLSGIKPTISRVHESLEYRIDGNNVDIDAESLDLYETSVKYDVMANGIMNNYKRINYVFQLR